MMAEDHRYIPPWQSVGHLLREQATRFPETTLFRFEGTEATFSQIEARTNQLANVLVNRGVRKGDRVALMMPNGIDFPTCWLAILKIGAVMVPINIQYQEADLTLILSDSGASLALAGEEQIEKLINVEDNCPHLLEVAVLGGKVVPDGVSNLSDEMESASTYFDLGDASRNDLANIQYTSGTTGFPKGCMLTHDYWMLLGKWAAENGGIGADDVVLTAQPFTYMDPQWNTIMCIIAGIPLVILPRFSASTFWKSVKENNVTFFYLLGTMPVYLLKQPQNPEFEKGHKVRRVACSGIVPQLHKTFEERWNVPWREAYGMTETGVDLYVPFEDTDCVGSGAMGKPVATKEARVVDKDGNDVPDGEAGELIVRGKPMMRGYWNNPGATEKTIRDGWLHTGDLAHKDEKGYFHLVGRLKDMIRRSGENISAAEVEAVLCEHPEIQVAACVPVADELRGEEVKAFIQPQDGSPESMLDPQEIIDFAAARLAAFKVPRFVEFIDEFPFTPSERIAKHKLLEQKRDQRKGAYDSASGNWG